MGATPCRTKQIPCLQGLYSAGCGPLASHRSMVLTYTCSPANLRAHTSARGRGRGRGRGRNRT